MSAIRWTASQRAAIETTGTNVLVSAGAGSGKTAVLAERCARLMADGAARCGVERFVVVTFTDAAAAEMRERIGRALRARQTDRPDDPWLARQIALLETAAISTLHSFCRRTLNRHFAEVDLDPQTPILDEQEAALLRRETARAALDELAAAAGPRGEAVLDFLAAYGSAGDRRVLEAAESLNAFLGSLPNAAQWRDEALWRYSDGAAWEREWAAVMRSELCEQLALVESLVATTAAARATCGEAIDKLRAWVEPYRDALQSWHGMMRGRQDADAAPEDGAVEQVAAQIAAFGFGRLDFKRWTKGAPGEAAATLESLRDELVVVRDKYFKRRLLGEFGAADWAAAAEGIARTSPHVKTFFDIAAAARRAYDEARRAIGAIDFTDLERYMLALLRDEANGVARRLRDRFEHVLVDEFQDINPVQAEIIRLISRENDADRPGNLFCVGDVKQSIYRFRLAEPRLFMERADRYVAASAAQGPPTAPRPGVRIDLAENFRSRPAVLDAVNAVFERLMTRDLGGIDYDDRARLRPGNPDADRDGGDESRQGSLIAAAAPVELHLLDRVRGGAGDSAEGDDEPGSAATGRAEAGGESASGESATGQATQDNAGDGPDDGVGEALDWLQMEREAYVIGRRIAELAAGGVDYGDIVVLLRSIQLRSGLLMRTLARMGIPVLSESDSGLLEALETRDLLALLGLLDNARQDIPLAAVMRSPLLGEAMTDDDLARIRAASPGVSFCEAVFQYAETGEDAALRARAATRVEAIARWRQRSRQLTPADLLWAIYVETGYLSYVSGLRDGAQRRANLVCLHELARQFGAFQRQGLGRFLEFVRALADADRDLPRGSVAAGNVDAVRVMSIHKSKGLEFGIVILGELGKRINFADARQGVLMDRRLGVGLKAVDLEKYITYPTLPHRLVKRSLEQESLAEELRVLYVAMTRAKRRVIMIGSGRLDALEKQRRRLAGRVGPLPILDRRSATTMLDWMLPAICAQPAGRVSWREADASRAAEAASSVAGRVTAGEALFSVTTYSTAAMSQWQLDAPARRGADEQLTAAAAMQPIPGAAPEDAADVVRAVRRRLTTPYPLSALTRVPAVASASVLKRRWETRQDADEPVADVSMPALPVGGGAAPSLVCETTPSRATAPAGGPLGAPRFARAGEQVEATRRGTLTHELMQRLDLTRPCDAADVKRQLSELVERGVFERREAGEIDAEAVAWFFSTELGRRLRRPGARVRREWPFVMATDAQRYDPAAVGPMTASGPAAAGDWLAVREGAAADDRMLVRGIVDCFFNAGDGWEIVDYKTDAVSGAALVERAALYRGQLAIYAEALAATYPGSALRRWLVFLSPREIVNVD